MRLVLLLIYFAAMGLMTISYSGTGDASEEPGMILAQDDGGTQPWIDRN